MNVKVHFSPRTIGLLWCGNSLCGIHILTCLNRVYYA